MTDNEIIKALELCANRTIHSCKSCPCNSSGCACNEKLNGGALDLINRQKAEIDRLKNELHGKVDYIHEQRGIVDDLKDKCSKKGLTVEVKFDKEQLEKIVQGSIREYEFEINEFITEAIKEFAEEHKKIMRGFLYNDSTDFLMKWCEYETNTDNLVKEMTEE